MATKTVKMNLGDAEKRGGFWLVPITEVEIRQEENYSRAYAVDSSKVGKKSIEDLGKSILEIGQEQACIGDINPDTGKARVKVGLRRAVACMFLHTSGLSEGHKLLIDIRPEISTEEAMMLNISENVRRENLTPMDLATAFGHMKESGLSGREIGTKLGFKEAFVSKHLAFLGLDKKTQKMLANGYIGGTSAYTLSTESPERREAILTELMEAYNISEEQIDTPAEEATQQAEEPGEEIDPLNEDEIPAGKKSKKAKKVKPAKKTKKTVIADKDVNAKVTGKGNQSISSTGRRLPEVRAALLAIEEDTSKGQYARKLATAIMAFMAGHKNEKQLSAAFDTNCKPAPRAIDEADEDL